jgi:hypothetical protein
MVLRWIAAGMGEARRQLRRGNGYLHLHLHLPAPRITLDTVVTPSKEDAA